MGEMMMKIGATKPVMKDTSPILKGVSGARRKFERENLDYNESIYCICTKRKTKDGIERVRMLGVKDADYGQLFSRLARRSSSPMLGPRD